jgi:HAD superfamily hydrolase (TIGR01509 family)
MIEAVIFDMDGVLIESEQLWDSTREDLTRERGGDWHAEAQRTMMGMSSMEWSRYMHDDLGVSDAPEWISGEVVRRLKDRYRAELPIIDGAVEAVRRLADRWPLAVASSSNRPLIDLVLELTGLEACFRTTASSEEVSRGKPEPDVYLAAAAGLGVKPEACVAVEDSSNGILAAASAGMRVVALPNSAFAPGQEALSRADIVLTSIKNLGVETLEGLSD